MFTKDEFDMLSLRSSSIYCRSAPIRYEINPSFATQTYRVRQQISCLYISPLARYANHIENPARDLSRCVFSVKDNTLTAFSLFFAYCGCKLAAFSLRCKRCGTVFIIAYSLRRPLKRRGGVLIRKIQENTSFPHVFATRGSPSFSKKLHI